MSKVNVSEIMGNIFPEKMPRTESGKVKVNPKTINCEQIKRLGELADITNVDIFRSGTGLLIAADTA